MVVPPFGAGDIVAVGTLAWNVYKSCKDAPGSFNDISNEVLSLHAVLKEADETILKTPLPPQSQARLKTICDGCQSVLSDLQALVDKYENLGTQSKWTWDRMKWGTENVVEIRSRLVSNATFLTAYIRWGYSLFKYLESQLMESLYSTSQTRVEQKLDKFINDIQQGNRAPSVISLQTADELNPDDEETWRTIRKELEDIGISVAAFDANKDFIFQWISDALNTGAFQEKTESSRPGSVLSLDPQSSTSSLSRWVRDLNKKTVISDTEPPKASKAKTKPTGNYTIMQAEQASNEIGAAGGPRAPAIPTKVPRFAAFLAALSQPKRRLEDALLASDLDRARKILKDPATSRLIDKQMLNNLLNWAIRQTSTEACALLIDAGADISDGRLYHQKLTMAVTKGEKDIVAFLLDRGADVNYRSAEGTVLATALRQGNRDLAAFLLDRGADVNCVDYQSAEGTVLAIAVRQGNKDLAAFLLDRGADVNYVNYHSGNGKSLLTMAVCQGNGDLTAYLLDRGADVNYVIYQSRDGKEYSSALRAAITEANEAMITLLSQRGADLNAVQSNGYPTGIHQASARNDLDIVDLLINLGADFNLPQRHYGTPLMLSIYNGCFSTAELLIKRGANINEVYLPLKHPGRLFHSAIHIAIYVSSPYLVALLLHNGVGTDLHEAYEFAAQHYAYRSRQLGLGEAMFHFNRPPLDKMIGIFDWETRKAPEFLSDAGQVLELLRKQKERSAV